MKITWIGQGGYLVEAAGRRLVIDPYLSDSVTKKFGLHRLAPPVIVIKDLKPDVIIITHDHLDHFDPDTLQPLMSQSNASLLGPQSVINHGLQMGFDEKRMTLVKIGEPVRFDGFIFTPTPAMHSDAFSVGLLLEAGGKRIYFSGDTLYNPELVEKVCALTGERLDAAFVCMNGRLNNMNSKEAAKFVARLKPGMAIPMHYGMFAENTADPNEFVDDCHALGMSTLVLETGGSTEI